LSASRTDSSIGELDVNLAAEPHFFSIARWSGRSTLSRFALLRRGNQGDGYRKFIREIRVIRGFSWIDKKYLPSNA